MATEKQKQAARRNIKKAQARWKSMSKQQRSSAQPEGRKRKRPGTGGGGEYYHIEIRPPKDFEIFRTQDVGEKGHLERRAGRRPDGSWNTVSWLIEKTDAHVENGELVIDRKDIRDTLRIRGPIKHRKGDIFDATPRKRVSGKHKTRDRK